MRIFSRFALLSMLCVFFLLAYALQTQAATVPLYDNYTSSGFEPNTGMTISGSGSPVNMYNSPSQSFTPSQTSDLSYILAPMSWVSGTNSVLLYLDNNNSGSPGSNIETWSLSTLPQLSTSFTPPQIQSISNPLLTSGVTYWLVAAPGDSTTWAAWNEVNNTSTPAFAVYGTPITPSQNTPEPGVIATLMSMGMAGGGIFLRRLRKA